MIRQRPSVCTDRFLAMDGRYSFSPAWPALVGRSEMTRCAMCSGAYLMPRVTFGKGDDLVIVAPQHSARAPRTQFGHARASLIQQPADVARTADMLGGGIAKPADAVSGAAPGGFVQSFGHVQPVGKPRQFARHFVGDPVGRLPGPPTGVGRAKEAGMSPSFGRPMRRDKADIHRSNPRHARAFRSDGKRVRGSAPQSSLRCGLGSLGIWRSHKHDTLTDRFFGGCVVSSTMRFGSIAKVAA